MIRIEKYTADNKEIWDNFIDKSKNGTFLLKRDFMEYHSDRFIDFSLLFYEDNSLIALLPASLHENEVRSHGGLTYGGIISCEKMTVQKMINIFDILELFLKEKTIEKLLYKRVPTIYHNYPADEDLYSLFRKNATLVRKDISTSIYLPQKLKFSELRRRSIKKALKNEFTVQESFNFKQYVELLNTVLMQNHSTKAVHTASELQYLANHFPNSIKLFCTFQENEMLAGVLIFETSTVVHTQYIANSEKGRTKGALDLLINYLIELYSKDKLYFDFGISTENNGRYLNEGLISQKEGFGGRAISYDFYELEIKEKKIT